MPLAHKATENSKPFRQEFVKISSVTVLTVICMLLVLLLHHATYTLDFLSPIRPTKVARIFQRFAVGGFIFLSGFKLATSKLTADIKSFLYGRVAKIYVLYLMALVLFAFTAYPHLNEGALPSVNNFILHAFALQSVFPGLFGANFHTLWFVSVLFLCYFVFLLVRTQLSSSVRFATASLALIVCIVSIRAFGQTYGVVLFQQDLEVWISFFLFGMLYSRPEINAVFSGVSRPRYASLISVGLALLIFLYNYSDSISPSLFYCAEFISLFVTLSAVYAWVLSKEFCVSSYVSDVFNYIAASSYCVFLLHRPIWTMFSNIWPERSLLQAIFIFGLGLPTIFVSSYLIQSSYQKLTVVKKAPST